MEAILHGLITVIGIILLIIVALLVLGLILSGPAMIASKCGVGVKIIVTGLYIIVAIGLVATLIGTPFAVMICKNAFTIIWDEK